MKTDNFYSSLLLLSITLLIAGCSKDEASLPASDNQAQLMSKVIGTYQVKGMYDLDLIDHATVSINQKTATELEIAGTDFPSFRIEKFSISYRNQQDSSEYVIDAVPSSPNTGTITFTFPDKEILVLTTIKVNETTKRDLRLTGPKQ